MHFPSLAVCLGLAGLAQAHMEMIYPPPFKSKANPNAGSDVDYSMTAPLDASGANFPCKGYQSLFGTKEGASVANWEAGGSYNMSITGGANHGGGSCQASLSYDKGKSWKVIHSYIGNCPGAGTTTFDFKVPSDAPSGEAIFAWTWFNRIGNREMYMNCAAVTIGGGSGKRAEAMNSRPDMFVANVGNGCTTEESSDLEFPDPGPDVSNDSQKTAGPKGTCGKAGSGSGNNDGNNGAAPSIPADGSAGGNNGGNNGAAPSVSAAPTQTQPAAQPSAPAAGAPSAYEPSPTSIGNFPDSQIHRPGGVFVTVSQPAEATGAPTAPSAPSNGGGAETSTLLTVTKPAPGTGGQPAPTSVASPEPAPTTPTAPGAGAGEGGSGSGSEETAGAACSDEGAWNCIGGTKYQRCASGQWSVVQSMAAGTTCSGNKTSAMAFGFGRKLAFRGRRV
ncbi:spore coat SP96 precursor [Fusarium beomiforme]|uniref:Spore coat SP96 n=1 Tax=Fusarium beomiforme TaxID=44412 RepID=A0A9P5E136_9HYPO|nr:spore coat SP96 precursor [Fusarium beomiforme]